MDLQESKKAKTWDRNNIFTGLPSVGTSAAYVDVCLSTLCLRLSSPLNRDEERKDTSFGQSDG